MNVRHRARPLGATLTLCASFAGLTLSACGGNKQEVEPPVMTQSASDEILRVGQTWQSVLPEQGLLSPPSKISFFKNTRTSTIELTEGAAKEELIIAEELTLRDGGEVKCRTVFEHPLSIRYGRKQGQAAVELVRPALNAPRTCTAPHPDGSFAEQPRRGLFVLRADALVAVEPPLEKRKYIPGVF